MAARRIKCRYGQDECFAQKRKAGQWPKCSFNSCGCFEGFRNDTTCLNCGETIPFGDGQEFCDHGCWLDWSEEYVESLAGPRG